MKTIYGLFDRRDDVLRYVGQTKLPLEKRRGCRRGLWFSNATRTPMAARRPVDSWVLDVGKDNLGIKALEVVADSEADAREQFWIATATDLFNIAIGGPGTTGTIQSERTRAKRSAKIKDQWAVGEGAA